MSRPLFALLLLAPLAPAESDPRLVGTYRHTTSHVSGRLTVVVDATMVLRPDGTCQITTKGRASHDGDSTTGGKDRPLRGTWEVLPGKKMVFRWDGGRVETLNYIYGTTGGGTKLLLRAGTSGGRMWEKLR